MSEEYKLTNADIGEIIVMATELKMAGIAMVQLDCDTAVKVGHLAYDSFELNAHLSALRETLRLKELECQQLAQDKAELIVALTNVLHAESHNTGREPSLSVFHRAVDEALQLLDKHQ